MSTATEEKRGDGRKSEGRDDGRELTLGGRRVLSASPLIWVLLAGAVAWAIWATVTRGSSSSRATGMRAVLVPTASTDRMLVALPCSALGGSGGKSSSSGSARHAPGATSVVLPAGSGLRVVLVPGCQGSGSSGGTSGGSGGGGGGSGGSGGGSGSSGVMVLAPGSPAPKQGASVPSSGGSGAKVMNLFTVPGSARVILVTPCQGKQSGSGHSQSQPTPSGDGVLVTPPCGGG